MKNSPLNSKPLRFCSLFFLVVIFAHALFLHSAFSPDFISTGVDSSWIAVLNHFAFSHIRFGKDLIWTFGPLGFLYSRTYFSETYGSLAIGWITLGSAMFFCLKDLLPKSWPRARQNLWLWIAIVMSGLSTASTDSFFFALQLAAFYVMAQNIEQAGGRLRVCHIVLGVSVLSGVALIKFSFCIVSLFLALCTAFLPAKHRWTALAVATSIPISAAFLWKVVGQDFADIFLYLRSSIDISRAYATGMSIAGGTAAPASYAGLALLGALWSFFGANAYSFRSRAMRASSFLGVAFVVFKAGFTRQDDIHELIPSSFLAMAFLIVLATSWPLVARRRDRRIGIYILLGILIYTVIGFRRFQPYPFHQVVERTFTRSIQSARNACVLISDPNVVARKGEMAQAQVRKQMPLPATKGTADVYPTALAAILANHDLNYSPRPIIQSYQAATPTLEAANAAHLREQGPDHVFFSLVPSGERLPSIEDAQSIPVLRERYILGGRTPESLHLIRSRNRAMESRSLVPLSSKDVEWGEFAEVPMQATSVWLVADATPTLLGKIAQSFWRWLPAKIHIKVQLFDGEVVTLDFSAPIEMLRAGCLISPLLLGTDDLGDWIDGKVFPKFRTAAVSFENPNPGDYFSSSLHVRFSEIPALQ